MNPVHLHFETHAAGAGDRRRHRARAVPRWQRWLLSGALVLAGVACGLLAQRLWQQQLEWVQTTAALQATKNRQTHAGDVTTTAQAALSANERAAWARVASALNTPWNNVFDTLERSIPGDVALISIEPDATKATLRLEAEAATLDALLKGARALGEAEGIAQLALVKHETQEQQPDRAVRLVVELQMRRAQP